MKMDPLVLVALIGFATACVNLIPVIVVLVRQGHANENILKIEKATNSMMEKREVAAEKLGHDKGMAQSKRNQDK